MEQNNHTELTPVQRFLSTRERLREYSESGDHLPYYESGRHLESMMVACEQLIRDNHRLEALAASAEVLLEEQAIDIALKDLEIFNFTTQEPKDLE